MNPPPSETADWFLAQPSAFHGKWMAMALAEARAAAEEGEVPMGCVVVRRLPDGTARPVGRAHNQVEALRDPTAHAEVLAITQAAAEVGDWRLTDCALYVTKEPCPMCGGAIVLGRLALVAWAASDPPISSSFARNAANVGCTALAALRTSSSQKDRPDTKTNPAANRSRNPAA